MKRFPLVLLAAALLVQAQAPGPRQLAEGIEFANVLSFEAQPTGQTPGGWQNFPPGAVFTDETVVHGGKRSVRIERQAASSGKFSSILKSIPIDFSGSKIELRGFLKTEDVSEFAGLLMSEESDNPSTLAFDNMQARQLKGTTGWNEYSIVLPIQPGAKSLSFGVMMAGTGKVWADDLQLLIDGKPVWEVPKVELPKIALDLDHEFEDSSRIALTQLTPNQTTQLTTLGKVWGFLKYHHPRVTSGKIHWDFELFRVMPSILAARNRTEANAVLVRWIAGLGAVPDCVSCANLVESDLYLRPDLRWLSREDLLGKELSKTLLRIYKNRPADKTQFYVSLIPFVGNPVFQHELSYEKLRLPDPGFQILALYRFWNIIEYWFPYRDLLGENWDDMLAEFLPRIALAKQTDTYQRELMAFIAKVHDTHANLWSSLRVRPPTGDCQLPLKIRFINDHEAKRAVVTAFSGNEAATDLKAGDVIAAIDDVTVPKMIQEWAPYYAASNEPTRFRDIARFMTRGACSESTLQIRREDKTWQVKMKRLPASTQHFETHDLPGETFRLLSKDVAYLKLSSVKAADVTRYVEAAAGTKGLIIDIRNYPSEFVVFALGSLLVERDVEFARFTVGDVSNPGAFHWGGKRVSLSPKSPHYSGKIIILIDETSQSQAEYTAMAFRSAANAVVVGSTTAGADGNVSQIPLPGGLQSMISGIGVFYPDKRPTQRIGIIPDVKVEPTIAGIRSSRDEILVAAIRQILGPEPSPANIEKMAKP